MSYEFEVILVDKGSNYHYKFRKDELEGKVIIKGKQYEINSNNLFLVDRGLKDVIKDMIRRVRHRFITIFDRETCDSISVLEKESLSVDGEILSITEESQLAKKGLASTFQRRINSKIVIGIIIVTIVIFVGILVLTGKLQLPFLK